MRRLCSFALVALFAFSGGAMAEAGSLQFGTLTLNTAATSGSCPFPATGFNPPVAVGTTLCTITVTPAGWVGAIGNPAGGADSAKFAVVAGPGGVGSVLQNTVALTVTGSAAGNGTYVIGSSTLTP